VSRVRLFSSGSAQARRGRGIADLRAGDFKVAFGLLGESQEACECPVVGQVQLERPSGAGAHSVPFARRLSRRQAKLGFDFHAAVTTSPKRAPRAASAPSPPKPLSCGATTKPNISTLIRLGRIQPISSARPPPRAP
jgi:hypothetical protein